MAPRSIFETPYTIPRGLYLLQNWANLYENWYCQMRVYGTVLSSIHSRFGKSMPLSFNTQLETEIKRWICYCTFATFVHHLYAYQHTTITDEGFIVLYVICISVPLFAFCRRRMLRKHRDEFRVGGEGLNLHLHRV